MCACVWLVCVEPQHTIHRSTDINTENVGLEPQLYKAVQQPDGDALYYASTRTAVRVSGAYCYY